MRANEFIIESSLILVNPVVKNNANAMAVVKQLLIRNISHRSTMHEVSDLDDANFIIGPNGAIFFQFEDKYIVSSINGKLKVTTRVNPVTEKFKTLVGTPHKYFLIDVDEPGLLRFRRDVSRQNDPLRIEVDPGFQMLYKIIVENLYNQYSIVGDVPKSLEYLYDNMPTSKNPLTWKEEFSKYNFGYNFNNLLINKLRGGFIPYIKEIFNINSRDVYLYSEAIRTDKRLLYKELGKFLRKFILDFINKN